MKVAIVGTGAMGSVYAGLLGRAGHEVWAIDVWQDHVDAIARDGLAVSGASGTYVVPGINTGYKPGDAGPCDLWVIGTKAAAVEDVASQVAPMLRPDDIVMAFQNGLGAGERVARQIPDQHVVIGIAEGFGSSIPEPGVCTTTACGSSASARCTAASPNGCSGSSGPGATPASTSGRSRTSS